MRQNGTVYRFIMNKTLTIEVCERGEAIHVVGLGRDGGRREREEGQFDIPLQAKSGEPLH